jgi:hypothetical protein
VLKRSAGALYDSMWGPHCCDTIRERADRALAQLLLSLCFFHCFFKVFVFFVDDE